MIYRNKYQRLYLYSFGLSDFVPQHCPDDNVAGPEEIKSGQGAEAAQGLVFANSFSISTDKNTGTAPSEETCRGNEGGMRIRTNR